MVSGKEADYYANGCTREFSDLLPDKRVYSGSWKHSGSEHRYKLRIQKGTPPVFRDFRRVLCSADFMRGIRVRGQYAAAKRNGSYKIYRRSLYSVACDTYCFQQAVPGGHGTLCVILERVHAPVCQRENIYVRRNRSNGICRTAYVIVPGTAVL